MVQREGFSSKKGQLTKPKYNDIRSKKNMIKIDSRSKETLIFDVGLTGIRQPDQVLYRLILMITDSLSLCFKGMYDNGELIFNLPVLKDFMPVLDDKHTPFHIEMLVDDYHSIIYENEMELLTIPEIKIEKLTHIKPEVKEEKKSIKIDERIEVKEPSKFKKSFEVFITRGDKRNNDR